MLARVLRRCISIKSSRLTPEEIVAKTKRPLKPTSALSLPLSKTTKGRKGPAAVHMKASVDDLVDTTSAPMRLAKRMAMAGISSRREAEKIILDGRVVVNGSRVTQVAHNVTFDDVVTVDNKTLPARPSKRRVWIAHKLPGELVTSSDPRGRPTIMQRLKAMGFDTHVMAVGRLDYNTEGLLLLTNDGDYARFLEHPKHSVQRVYRVLVWGQVLPSKLDELRRGALVDGVKYRPMEVKIESTTKDKETWLQVKLTEGKVRDKLVKLRLTAILVAL
ncbi:hypothetical protein, variant 1 [Aphanomyces invadans]|uniref:RNA-binding S4 domain-containing protein n=1 Tax=Aphanomyces invadans TaxID=157072 RepID=A0A024TV97_9STRA|nr:hypothetical protein, variant 1 [Aphanomyces invadans]ETV97282.1 hypothetical protein, variant 1 [Aphanomyces invadans]|eukprot:XP_008873991.1 hypothetical protein, variant 1 [Aphanomyces invadans]